MYRKRKNKIRHMKGSEVKDKLSGRIRVEYLLSI